MVFHHKKYLLPGVLLLGFAFAYQPITYAAKPINLDHLPFAQLNTFSVGPVQINEVSRSVDFNNTLHIRIKQSYSGYPVWGGDGIVHVPKGGKTDMALKDLNATAVQPSMNGVIYQDLSADLARTPTTVFNGLQAQKALQAVLLQYQQKMGSKPTVTVSYTHLTLPTKRIV